MCLFLKKLWRYTKDFLLFLCLIIYETNFQSQGVICQFLWIYKYKTCLKWATNTQLKLKKRCYINNWIYHVITLNWPQFIQDRNKLNRNYQYHQMNKISIYLKIIKWIKPTIFKRMLTVTESKLKVHYTFIWIFF